MQVDQVPAHLQREHRHGQRQPDPEPPRHVGELGIGPRVGRHQLRLERHAADRAGAGPDLPDLGMHRAGVDRAFRDRLGARAARGVKILRADRPRTSRGSRPSRSSRCGRHASCAVLGGVRIDRHAAHRVLDAMLRDAVRHVRVVMGVARALPWTSVLSLQVPLGVMACLTPIPRQGIRQACAKQPRPPA